MHSPSVIELNIEELVLHGFAPAERYRIGEAVERELSRLLMEQTEMSNWLAEREVERINGGSFAVAPGARAETIGAQVAQSVFRALDGAVTQ